MQELLLREHEENSLLRDITGVQVCSQIAITTLVKFKTTLSQTWPCVMLQRLEDVTFLDAVVDCNETSLSNLGEVHYVVGCNLPDCLKY